MDKEKIQEGKIECFPFKEDKEPIHPFNQQQSLKRQGFEKGVEWVLKQVKNNGVLDDVIKCNDCKEPMGVELETIECFDCRISKE